jgi:hypothetical protein
MTPLLAEGRAGLSLQDFPEYWAERADMLFQISPQALFLFPVEGQGTLLVSLTWGDGRDPDPRLYSAHAVLFTADPRECRVAHFTKSNASTVVAQALAFFAIPNGTDENEQPQQLSTQALEGLYRWNVYWRLPGWPTSLYLFPPTGGDSAVTALMAHADADDARGFCARVVRFEGSGARCTQAVIQAPTLDRVINRVLLRYRFGALAWQWFVRARLWTPLTWLRRWIGCGIVVLLVLVYQLAAAGFVLGGLEEQSTPSAGVATATLLLFGLFGPVIELLPVFLPRLVTRAPRHWSRRLRRWGTVLLLTAEWSAFLAASLAGGHLWDPWLIIYVGLFLWLTILPVYAGWAIGRTLHGRQRARGGKRRGGPPMSTRTIGGAQGRRLSGICSRRKERFRC